jgi:WS/DGAT/MGAT family acyltransferase
MSLRRYFGERLTSADTAWLHMDSPTNLAVVTGVITFREPLDLSELSEVIEKRLLRYPRFRQRVMEPPVGLPRWVYARDFDLNDHLFSISLPEPADHETLQKMVSEMISIPLDMSKPLWELHYINNYRSGGALICRFHHCIADGIALVQILLSTAEEDTELPEFATMDDLFSGLSPLARIFVPMVVTTRILKERVQETRDMFRSGLQTITSPRRMARVAGIGVAGGLALGKLLLLPPDHKTLLRGQCGIPKKAAWSKKISVDEVKRISDQSGGTINDILLSAMTGALRRYLQDRGELVEGLNIHAIVPVNLRPPGDITMMGNQFGLVFLSLPVGVADPLTRLKVLKARMDAIKNTPEAVVAFGILTAMGISPERIEDMIRDIFGKKGSLVVTNVPGPRRALSLAGGQIEELMFWVPTPANLSLGVSIISYAGDFLVGVSSDAGLIPEPERVLDMFYEEFDSLKGSYSLVEETKPAAEMEQDPGEDAVVRESSNVEQPPSVEARRSAQCKAKTLKGTRCRNPAIQGSEFCHVHSPE